jgi:hypothetical protein
MVTMWLGIARPVILPNLVMSKSPSSLVTSSAVVVELIRSTFQTSTLAAADILMNSVERINTVHLVRVHQCSVRPNNGSLIHGRWLSLLGLLNGIHSDSAFMIRMVDPAMNGCGWISYPGLWLQCGWASRVP